MKQKRPLPDVQKINEEAARWLTRLSRGLDREEGAELRTWLGERVHREAILATATPWQRPDVVAMLTELFPDRPELIEPPRRQRSVLAMSVTGVLAMTIVTFGTLALMGREPGHFLDPADAPQPEKTTRTYITAVGGRQEVMLTDRSNIVLNTGTRVTVVFSATARDVTLEYGEASFDVAPDTTRPFNIRAGKREFQVLGTRFNVRVLNPDNVELTVSEGQVKVLYAPPRWPETPEKRRDNLSYGEQTLTALETALVEPGYQSVRPIVASEMDARLAWQRGMLVFDGTALEDVLAEVDRYTLTKFILADKALANLRIAGNFKIGDVDELLGFLRTRFSVDSRRDAQGRVVLSQLRSL